MQGDGIWWTTLHWRCAVFFLTALKYRFWIQRKCGTLIDNTLCIQKKSIYNFFLRIHKYSHISIIVLNLKYMVTLFANILILHGRSLALFLGVGCFSLSFKYIFSTRGSRALTVISVSCNLEMDLQIGFINHIII